MDEKDDEDLRRTAESLRLLFTSEHPDAEATLVSYVDGTLDTEDREWVEEHLAGCNVCRDDVADIRSAATLTKPERQHIAAVWWLLAAGVAGVAILSLVVGRAQRVEPPPVTMARQASRPDLVQEALSAGLLTPPAAWLGVQTTPDVVRGTQGSSVGGTYTPSSTVVEAQRPEFSWPRTAGAEYVVRVSSGANEAAKSEVLREPKWTATSPLARGTTYVWQIEVHVHGHVDTMPPPPHPPLLFAVADVQSANDLAAARKEHPDDYLRLGVLYARAGVREEARAQLAAWLSAHPGDAAARRLLESVERW
jgi:hypothetical protein